MVHQVNFNLPTRELGRADATFQIRRDDELVGTLAISNGSVVWFPRDKTYGHKLDWATFDTVMQNNSVAKERRKRSGA
jgi:hypothetical protein